jgi:DNA-binding NarL/FixJ family response regulator
MSEVIRVIVADDHPLFLDGLSATLSADEEIDVVGVARDASAAVALATSTHPDLALLDIAMPGGGLDAARQIAQSSPSTRVVMLTSSEDNEDLVAAMNAGSKGYVLKGIAGRELREILKSIHGGGKYVTPGLAYGAIRGLSRPPARDPLAELTERERDVLQLVAGGMSNAQIGGRLGLAEKTVKHHMTAILGKLEAGSRVEAALIAFKAGLVQADDDARPDRARDGR